MYLLLEGGRKVGRADGKQNTMSPRFSSKRRGTIISGRLTILLSVLNRIRDNGVSKLS